MAKKNKFTVPDQELWNTVRKTIKPLHYKPKYALLEPFFLNEDATFYKRHYQSQTIPPRVSHYQGLQRGNTANIDGRTAERFIKGKMHIEARLDLHGLSQEQAQKSLESFIPKASENGFRCVLVITGKGQGILKQLLPRVLNKANLRPFVLSISDAQPEDGGAGATYILLKRHRPYKERHYHP